MKKIFNENKFLIYSIIITLVIFSFFNIFFYSSYKIFYYSLISFINGLITYFKGVFLFDRNNNTQYFYDFYSNNDILDFELPISDDPNDFTLYLKGIFYQYWNMDYFKSSISNVAIIFNFIYIFITILLLIFILKLIFSSFTFSQKDKNKLGFTRFLNKYNCFQNKFIFPIKIFLTNLKITFIEYRFDKLFVLFVLFYLNIISIFLVFLSYLFDICITFNVLNLFYCLCSLLVLIIPILSKLPLFIWLIIAYILFRIIFKNRAKNKLYYLDSFNEEFVRGLGVSIFIDGVSGSGKTTISTLIAIYKEEIFRKLARKKLDKYMSYFPKFNFQLFNKYLDKLIVSEKINNRIQLKEYIKNRYDHFNFLLINGYKDINNLSSYTKDYLLFGYDLKFKFSHYNGLIKLNLFDVLVNYSECYFIYQRNALGLISNTPIQTRLCRFNDDYFVNFNDYWNEIDKNIDTDFYSSGIINYDSLRLGKTFNNSSPIVDSLVIFIDEVDKERGNQFSWRGLDNKDYYPNLLNDKFNWFVNTCRHGNLIDNDVFVSIILTCQREGDLTAGLIESCESIIDINRKSRIYKNTFYRYSIIERLLASFINDKLSKYCYKYLQTRNYYSFIYYVLFSLKSMCSNYLDYVDNRFGYDVATLTLRDPKQKIEDSNKKFFVIYKRIYANNFKSNGLNEIYDNKALNSSTSFINERKFVGLHMTLKDLDYQNSYFVKNIKKDIDITNDINNLSDGF